MKLNFIYTQSYPLPLQVSDFKYEMYEPANNIGTIAYKNRIEPFIPEMISRLKKDPATRQAVITLNRIDFESCLLSVQWQIKENILLVTACYRSQAEEYRGKDTKMILYWTDKILQSIPGINKVELFALIGNYHFRGEVKI